MSIEIEITALGLNKLISEAAEKLFKYNYTTISLITIVLVGSLIALACIEELNATNVILVVGLYISAITAFTQREKFHLAKVESEISSLLPYRLEIIKELAVIFEDATYYDAEDNQISVSEELYYKHARMVGICFGDRAEALFEWIKNDERRIINLSKKENTDKNDDQFSEIYTRYLDNKSKLYNIFYKSIRVRSNL